MKSNELSVHCCYTDDQVDVGSLLLDVFASFLRRELDNLASPTDHRVS